MATINDIGTAGQPLSTPPLTAWQAAVRDKFGGLKGGVLEGTTNGSGQLVVAHGVGRLPSAIILTFGYGAAMTNEVVRVAKYRIAGLDATNVVVLVIRADTGVALANTAVHFYFIAV